MITPSFGLTATERVLPRLALDFTTASLDSRITFTRALNTATRVNSSGFVETVNADVARFDYDPVTKVCKGLLIEESRSNLLTYSQLFSDSIWIKTNATITDNALKSPSGSVDAGKIVETTATAQHWMRQEKTVVANTAHTVSLYAKAGERDKIRFGILNNALSSGAFAQFNLTTGVISGQTTAGTATSITYSMVAAGDGWYRCAVTAIVDASSTVITPFIGILDASGNPTYTGDGTSGFYAWAGQMEAGAFPTSYIPTTTTSLTRNADVATMTGANFSDWFNASEGAVVAQFDVVAPSSAGYNRLFSINDGTANNTIECMKSNGVNAQFFSYVSVAAAGQAILYSSAITANTTSKIAMAYKLNNFAAATNGATLVTDTSGTLPTVDRLAIGNAVSTNQMNGHMQKLFYYPQRVINAEVTAFSKG